MGGIENQTMFQELTGFERSQIGLKMNNEPASPMQIVQAHMVREDQTYMRDYVLDEAGDIREIQFQRISVDR